MELPGNVDMITESALPPPTKARNLADLPVNRCPGAKLAGSSGVTHSGEQEGESQPFRGWKGKGISPPANLKRVTAEAVKR